GGLGQLFKNPARLYVYPSLKLDSGQVVTAENFAVTPHLKHLYAYLLENRFLQGTRDFDTKLLPIRASDVLAKIQSGDDAWEQLVPPPIVEIIKQERLFGYGASKVIAGTR